MELGPPKRASRHSKLPSALALAALLLAGCVPQGPPPTVKTAPTLQAVSVAPGQLVQPLALTAFQLDFAPGKAVDYYQVGTSCQPLSATPNTSRSVDISGDQAQQLLLGFVADAFEDRGYRIDRSGKAGLTVTATWIAYTTDICKPYTSIGDSQTGHGRVWVQVRWVLAERSTGRVLLARETEGNGKVVSTIEKVSTELLRLALHQAAGNLLADPEVVALITGASVAASQDAAPASLAPGKAPSGPSGLNAAAQASAQAAFDSWLDGNRAVLAAALDVHLAALGRPVPGGVQSILGAAVRDVTNDGYLTLLTYGTAGGSDEGLFQVTLSEGRLKRILLLQ